MTRGFYGFYTILIMTESAPKSPRTIMHQEHEKLITESIAPLQSRYHLAQSHESPIEPGTDYSQYFEELSLIDLKKYLIYALNYTNRGPNSTTGKPFLPFLDEGTLEIVDKWQRHVQDCNAMITEAANERGVYPETVIDICKLLVGVAVVPSFTISEEKIKNVYYKRRLIIAEYFVPESALQKYITLISKDLTEPEQRLLWQRIHKNEKVWAMVPKITEPEGVAIDSRRKTLVSTVAKLMSKSPSNVTHAVNIAFQYIRTYWKLEQIDDRAEPRAGRFATEERRQQWDANREKEQNELNTLFEKLGNELNHIRSRFSSTINDLFGLSFTSHDSAEHAEERSSLTDESQKHQLIDRRLRAESQTHITLFSPLIKKYLGEEMEEVYQSAHETFAYNPNITQNLNKTVNPIILALVKKLTSTKNAIEEILTDKKLSGYHREFFQILFLAKKSGWKIKEVSDYVTIFKQKKGPQGQWLVSHMGLQIQVTEETNKTFEMQFKTGEMSYSSHMGLGDHTTYKKTRIQESRDAALAALKSAQANKGKKRD
jgi:hypothetical protein